MQSLHIYLSLVPTGLAGSYWALRIYWLWLEKREDLS